MWPAMICAFDDISSAQSAFVLQDAVFEAAGAGQEQLGALDRFAKRRKVTSE